MVKRCRVVVFEREVFQEAAADETAHIADDEHIFGEERLDRKVAALAKGLRERIMRSKRRQIPPPSPRGIA